MTQKTDSEVLTSITADLIRFKGYLEAAQTMLNDMHGLLDGTINVPLYDAESQTNVNWTGVAAKFKTTTRDTQRLVEFERQGDLLNLITVAVLKAQITLPDSAFSSKLKQQLIDLSGLTDEILNRIEDAEMAIWVTKDLIPQTEDNMTGQFLAYFIAQIATADAISTRLVTSIRSLTN